MWQSPDQSGVSTGRILINRPFVRLRQTRQTLRTGKKAGPGIARDHRMALLPSSSVNTCRLSPSCQGRPKQLNLAGGQVIDETLEGHLIGQPPRPLFDNARLAPM